jgi:PGDYG protein
MDTPVCRTWPSSWLIAAASLIGLIGSTSAQTPDATRDMNVLKTTGGLAWMRDTIWVQKRPMPLDVHFAIEKDLIRTDPPYSKGRILTLETAPGDPGVAFVAGDAIVTGSKGESWPIARAIFDATYAPTPGGRSGADGTFVKKPLPVLAVQMNEPFSVTASWGKLVGNQGDWLVQYDDTAQDFGIVAADIFEQTYERLIPTPALQARMETLRLSTPKR